MNIGKTLKFIRENKGLSQREFCKGVISNSFYSKVESEKSHISAGLLFELLEAQNIAVSEFYFIHNQYKNEQSIYIIRSIKAFFTNEQVEKLIELKNNIKTDGNKKLYVLLIENLILVLKNEIIIDDNTKKIIHYLVETPTWGHFEFYLFILGINFFDVETTLLLSSNIIKNLTRYSEYINYESDLILLLLNIIKKMLLHKEIEQAHYFLQLAKKYQKTPIYVYERLLINFFESIITDRQSDISLETTLIIFESFNLNYLTNDLKKIIKIYNY